MLFIKEKEREAQKKTGGGGNPKLAELWDDTGILLCHPSSFAIKEKKNPLHKRCPERGRSRAGDRSSRLLAGPARKTTLVLQPELKKNFLKKSIKLKKLKKKEKQWI